MLYYILIILGAAGLDRLVKYWAAVKLQPVGTMKLIPGVFQFTYAENTGMAFSMFRDKTSLLAVVSVLAIVLMLVALFKRWLPHKASMIGLSLLIGGAIGNMIDRIFIGYVVDLFDFCLIHYAIFNVADAFINIGAYLLVIDAIIEVVREEKAKKAKKAAEAAASAAPADAGGENHG